MGQSTAPKKTLGMHVLQAIPTNETEIYLIVTHKTYTYSIW